MMPMVELPSGIPRIKMKMILIILKVLKYRLVLKVKRVM